MHAKRRIDDLPSLQLLQAVTGHNPNTQGSGNAVILLCGVAKMFVGELIEEGLPLLSLSAC